jgi:multidrug efflux pump subunit AcrB
MFIRLKPREERKKKPEAIIRTCPKLAQLPGMQVFLQNPPPIRLGGRSQYQFTLQDTDTEALYAGAQKMEQKMRGCPDSWMSRAICRSRTLRSRWKSTVIAPRRSASLQQIEATLQNATLGAGVHTHNSTNEYL